MGNKITFEQAVELRIKQLGLLHKFVAEKINITPVELSQHIGGHRPMPKKVRRDLLRFLNLDKVYTS